MIREHGHTSFQDLRVEQWNRWWTTPPIGPPTIVRLFHFDGRFDDSWPASHSRMGRLRLLTTRAILADESQYSQDACFEPGGPGADVDLLINFVGKNPQVHRDTDALFAAARRDVCGEIVSAAIAVASGSASAVAIGSAWPCCHLQCGLYWR